MSGPGKSLKAQNLPWLCAVIALDSLAIVAISVAGDITGLANVEPRDIKAAGWLAVLPPGALMLTNLLPAWMKESLVFWRRKEVLPGHRAFSLAKADSRLDLASLQAHIGPFPEDPAAQNTLWYKLYRDVQQEPSVIDSHRTYLLMRELACISALGVVGSPLVAAVGTWSAAGTCASLFLVQYLASALAGKMRGERFVQNVLVLHQGSKPKRPTRKSAAPKVK